MRGLLAFLIGFFFMTGVIATSQFISKAYPHADAWWIEAGKYKSNVGSLCCGEQDCKMLPEGDVIGINAGYYVKSLKETIPYSEAQPSPDGRYWRCSWPTIADRKCFFSPPPGS